MLLATRLAVSAAALVLLTAGLAEAKAPPTGKYECTISGMLFGKVTIKSGNRYARNGKAGRFKHGRSPTTSSDGVKGYTLKFRSGSFKGFKGRWYKAADGTPSGTYEIALENPLNGFESIYCVRRK